MRYVFFSTGSWEKSASMVRFRELGNQFMIRGVDVLADAVKVSPKK